jgi:aspartyl-tRNA(Asn)/glutamyl-tRNA(Gln) amidotransferase subunit A
MSLTDLTAAELALALAQGEASSQEATTACLERIAATDGDLNAFLHVDAERALAAARAVDARRAAGEALAPLAGVPVAVKDAFVLQGAPTTCGSRILEGWRPPYDATVVSRLRAAGLVILGKTNMDEFAMGSSTENSAYGPTRNPWDRERVPGGSGGGSAACLAARQAPLAIGSDTGGSIRQPAAVTGTVGVKPTYGGVSRYGLVAMASSLDQPGPCARTALDAALLHTVIAGHDPRDSTSLDAPTPPVVRAARDGRVDGLRLGVVQQLGGQGYAPGVEERFQQGVNALERAGAEVRRLSCPHFPLALAAYYLIMPSEASSNLARFDAVRYGLRVGDDGANSVEQVMRLTRGLGFGDEVKRRVILGTYALSAGYYEAYYGSAQKVRDLVRRDFAAAFEQVDVLVSPACPTTAWRLGERTDDPWAMYQADLCTVPVNLAGNCAASFPAGLSPDDGLPVGLQVMAPAGRDDLLYRVGAALERALGPSPAAPDVAPTVAVALTAAGVGPAASGRTTAAPAAVGVHPAASRLDAADQAAGQAAAPDVAGPSADAPGDDQTGVGRTGAER